MYIWFELQKLLTEGRISSTKSKLNKGFCGGLKENRFKMFCHVEWFLF